MKTVLFVGAGKFQVAGIKKAKEMGLNVIATDGDPLAPGFSLADRSFVMDVKDVPAHIDLVGKHPIDAVTCVASDISLKTTAQVAEILGLPGVGVDVAERCTDKAFMRRAFIDHGVPSPVSLSALDLEDFLKKAVSIGFPVVVKPADSAGSRGVNRIERFEDLAKAYGDAVSHSAKKKVVVEQFLDGVEVSVEAFVTAGHVHVIMLSDKIRTPPPALLDTEVLFPSAYSDKDKGLIIAVAEKAIRAVGIQMGPVHMELLMTSKGPVPVELANRGAGFKVYTNILPLITGIDTLKVQIEQCLGHAPKISSSKQHAAIIKFIDVADGFVSRIEGLNRVQLMPGVYEAEIYVKPGDKVRKLRSGSDRIGHIITQAGTRDSAALIMAQAFKELKIDVQTSGGR